MTLSVVLLAAGHSTRLGLEEKKPFLPLGEKKVFEHSLDLFLSLSFVKQVILVAPSQYHHLVSHPSVTWTEGGSLRQESAYLGVKKASFDYVAIHDTARPLVSKEVVTRVFEALTSDNVVAPILPVTDTIRQKTSEGWTQLQRESLFQMQTPQMTSKTLFLKGYEKATQEKIVCTDDVQLANLAKAFSTFVLGDKINLKITDLNDLNWIRFYYETLQAQHCV